MNLKAKGSLGYVSWVLALIFFRFLALKPAVIDDDEAWFSVSAKALKNPFDFYTQTPDNKPPGTVWFYSLFHGELQLNRFALIILIVLTAFLLGHVVYKITRSEISKWVTTGLLISTSAIFPKLNAVTNEGLILVLSSSMLSIWALAIIEEKLPAIYLTVISGLLMAALLLIKQTSLVYLAPVAYSMYLMREKGVTTRTLIFSAAWIVPTVAAIYFLGGDKYLFWNFTYTSTVLTAARSSLFSEGKELLTSLILFVLALWPLLWSASKTFLKKPFQIFLAVWFFSSLTASVAGWGLFLHYFIPMTAPLCLAVGSAYSSAKSKGLAYVSAIYMISCCVFLIPYSGSFWGTDLFYYNRLAKDIQSQTRPTDSVFVWGGNTLALALSERQSIPGFLSSRFATPPYSTADLESQFKNQLAQTPPLLFIDLHERHDNRFSTSPLSLPWLKEYLELHYNSFSSPSVPWTTFYRLSETKLPLKTATDNSGLIDFQALSKKSPAIIWNTFFSTELAVRVWESVELLRKSDLGVSREKETQEMVDELRPLISRQIENPAHDEIELKQVSENVAERISEIYLRSGVAAPLPLQGRAWWISFAIQKLQPAGN